MTRIVVPGATAEQIAAIVVALEAFADDAAPTEALSPSRWNRAARSLDDQYADLRALLARRRRRLDPQRSA